MISIAADLERVYRVEDGAWTVYLQADPADTIGPMAGPPETAVQIAASREAIFALTATGRVYTRLSAEGSSWARIAAPDGTVWISTDDDYVYTLAGGIRQRLLVGGTFGRPANASDTTLVQIDHDESLVYALADDGRVLTRLQNGGWREYLPLGGVVEVVGSRNAIYARTGDGDVHRSHVHGRGGWERLGIDTARALAVSADHRDTLYVGTDTGVRAVAPFDWAGRGGVVRAYISDDYISGDYIITGAG